LFDDYDHHRRMHEAWQTVRIERPVEYSLFTFGDTVMPYYLVLGGKSSQDLVKIRRGDVRVARAKIITPDSLRPEFRNFFEDHEFEDMIEFLLARSAAFSNLKVSNQHGPEQIVSDSIEEVVNKLNRQLDDEEEEHVAILSAPPLLAGVAVLRYTAERIWQSTPDNLQELRERGFLP
jgi:hypothetical protein